MYLALLFYTSLSLYFNIEAIFITFMGNIIYRYTRTVKPKRNISVGLVGIKIYKISSYFSNKSLEDTSLELQK